MTTLRSRFAFVRIAMIVGALGLAPALAPGVAAQDWTADCSGSIEAMLLPEPLDGTYRDGTPARARAIVVNDCVPDQVWFVVTNAEGTTWLSEGGEIILDDRPGD